MNTREPLVVTEVEVGLKAVLRHVAFSVLIRVQRAWVDVDVWVEFLDGYLVSACLQQFADAGGDNAFS